MEGLQKVTNTVSNGTIHDPLRPPVVPLDWGSQSPNQNSNQYYFRKGEGYASQIFYALS